MTDREKRAKRALNGIYAVGIYPAMLTLRSYEMIEDYNSCAIIMDAFRDFSEKTGIEVNTNTSESNLLAIAKDVYKDNPNVLHVTPYLAIKFNREYM